MNFTLSHDRSSHVIRDKRDRDAVLHQFPSCQSCTLQDWPRFIRKDGIHVNRRGRCSDIKWDAMCLGEHRDGVGSDFICNITVAVLAGFKTPTPSGAIEDPPFRAVTSVRDRSSMGMSSPEGVGVLFP